MWVQRTLDCDVFEIKRNLIWIRFFQASKKCRVLNLGNGHSCGECAFLLFYVHIKRRPGIKGDAILPTSPAPFD